MADVVADVGDREDFLLASTGFLLEFAPVATKTVFFRPWFAAFFSLSRRCGGSGRVTSVSSGSGTIIRVVFGGSSESARPFFKIGGGRGARAASSGVFSFPLGPLLLLLPVWARGGEGKIGFEGESSRGANGVTSSTPYSY